jgi:acetoin:2,6-dichlorophenolindophenol oxidoreductase subunit beta
VRNTPLAEGIIAGTAAGAAATGLRPIVDLLFAPFLCFAMDEIVNSAGKLRYLSGGQFSFPMVILALTARAGVSARSTTTISRPGSPTVPVSRWSCRRAQPTSRGC